MNADGGTFRVEDAAKGRVLYLAGRLDAASVATLWEPVFAVQGETPGELRVDCSGVSYLDGAGAGLLLELESRVLAADEHFFITDLDPRYERLLAGVDRESFRDALCFSRDRRGFLSELGHLAGNWAQETKALLTFVGESAALAGWAFRYPRKVRWSDVWLSAIQVGVNSLPILLLIGFLMGLILSFQSAVSLKRFAAEIFVPNMLGLVMFREMGALITAILLAARSGSAFAAEIGTMKVNEEVDALVTMGLSPMRFLVLPKVLATLFMVPVMTLFFNFAALLGGAVVMLSLGFPLATFTTRVFMNTKFTDFSGGMLKVMVFSLLVAGVGCLRGMQTKSGAGAVGVSTTRAVVSGLILIAVADGLFAVAFFYLGL